jgi:hypothetical protein
MNGVLGDAFIVLYESVTVGLELPFLCHCNHSVLPGYPVIHCVGQRDLPGGQCHCGRCQYLLVG